MIKKNNSNNKIIIFGNGFSGSYLIKKALTFSSNIFVISRFPLKQKIKNVRFLDFHDVEIVSKKLNNSIIISTVSPDSSGQDPVLAKYKFFFKSSNSYFGYISSTSVYGEGILFEDSKTETNDQDIAIVIEEALDKIEDMGVAIGENAREVQKMFIRAIAARS